MKSRLAFVLVGAVLLALPAGAAAASPEERAASAYERIWQRADVLYGAEGQPSPFVDFVPDLRADRLAEVMTNGETQRVRLGPKVTAGLAEKGFTRRVACATLVHEWAHVYQFHESDLVREGGAVFFGHRFARRTCRLPYRSKLDDGYAAPEREAFRRAFGEGPEAVSRAQFGENLGTNPRRPNPSGLRFL